MTSVLFIGSKQMGLECLNKLHALRPAALRAVMTFDDRADARSVFDDFRMVTSAKGLPLLIAENRRHSEQIIADLRPDLCLVVGWYWLLSGEVLQKVPRGVLGIHNSLLPKYRGAAPLVWAMIRGEREVGFTLFSFTAEMDDGDVWGQRRVAVEASDYVGDVMAKLQAEALALLDERWVSILDGGIKPTPQDHTQATYAGMRIPEDGAIDWNKPAWDVYNFIRAQSDPYPGAFTFMGGQEKLTIWRARPIDVCFAGTPGQVAQVRGNGVYVICGDNRPLLVETVSMDGEPRRAASEILKSLKTRLHSRVAA